ncbi:hypothetical protein ACFWHG_17110 [Streptomyces microflavus]|uniref:hypothetical protein n=1 Tax=Streptomyces microflavus TaxID=1919 RepID=UPI00365970AB
MADEFPQVLLGERDYGSGQAVADQMLIDNVAAVRQVTTHLAALGHTRIGAIGVDEQRRRYRLARGVCKDLLGGGVGCPRAHQPY